MAVTQHLQPDNGIAVHGIWAYIIIIGAVSMALGAFFALTSKFFRKFILPLFKMGLKFEEAWPTLEQIASDFRGNGHGTLSDQLHNVANGLRDVTVSLNQRAVKLDELTNEVQELNSYSHSARHELLGRLTTLEASYTAAGKIADALKETVTEMKEVKKTVQELKKN